jgi:hypothetical protein
MRCIKQIKMKKQFCKKPPGLITIIIFAIAVLLFNGRCSKETKRPDYSKPTAGSSKIINTDLVPDTIGTCSGACSKDYYLDLNKDGINDFSFSVRSSPPSFRCGGAFGYGNSTVGVLPLNSNFVSSSKLVLNEIIGNNISWYNTSQVLRNCTAHCVADIGFIQKYLIYSGNWVTSTDGYLSLKIKAKNQVYYGWVRLSLSATGLGASFTMKDYAYNATANESILAGQTK